MTAGVEVEGLRKRFGEVVALDGLDLHVAEGTVHGLLGPNGAGKTTLVNILATLIHPDSGTARVAGLDVVAEGDGVREVLSTTGQYASLDRRISGRANLVLFGRLRGLTKRRARERADELLTAFALTHAADRPIATYSGGMRRRLDIACGLVTEPSVVILDEPTTGLDPRSRADVWALVADLRDRGITVLLTSQYLDEVDVLSDRVTVIDHGRAIADGTVDEIKGMSGPKRCVVRPTDPAAVDAVAGLLAGLHPETDTSAGAVRVVAPEPEATLTEVLRRLAGSGIGLADIGVRAPTLDEAFLHLTGGPAEASPDAGVPVV